MEVDEGEEDEGEEGEEDKGEEGEEDKGEEGEEEGGEEPERKGWKLNEMNSCTQIKREDTDRKVGSQSLTCYKTLAARSPTPTSPTHFCIQPADTPRV